MRYNQAYKTTQQDRFRLQRNMQPIFLIMKDNLEFPAIGSRWLNDRRKKVYIVVGRVSHCESDSDDDWEVLYRSDDMPTGAYRRRSLESWYGINRDGNPRFARVEPKLELEID